MKLKYFAATLMSSLLLTPAAYAACAFENTVPVRAITAAFPAWKMIAEAMEECGNVRVELDQEVRTKEAPAFAANPSLYEIGSVHNGTIVPLLNEGTIRPLDDLVAKYGQNLNENQLIKVNGKIMAIAFMVNMQHLMYRKDILDKLNIAVPETYDELIVAAQTIRDADVVDYPLGGTFKGDFNIGLEFNNLFVGYGGKFVNDDNTPSINSEAGLKTLERLKQISEFLDPEYLVADAVFVQRQFQQGKIAMANFWASRAAEMDNADESTVVGLIETAAAPQAVAGGVPAANFSWDGFVIAKNITDEQADAAFRVAIEGGDVETVTNNNDAAVWLIDGYVPGRLAKGAIETVEQGAPSSPSEPWLGLISTAVQNNVVSYLRGNVTAEQALLDIEAQYTVAAKEAGLL